MELASTLRPFYCDVCDKQFQNVAQYDEHTNSYAHHHKIRFRDMQAAQRAQAAAQGVIDARREKERKREEKELKKLAKAHGVQITAPIAATTAASSSTVPVRLAEKPKAGGGWAAVSAPAATVVPRFGIGAASSVHHGPAFRTGGWASLDDPASQAHGPTAASHAVPPSAVLEPHTPNSSDPINHVDESQHSNGIPSLPLSSSASMPLPDPVPTGGFRSTVAPIPSVAVPSTRPPNTQSFSAFTAPPSIAPVTSSSSGPILVPLEAPTKKTGSGKKKAKKEEATAREQSRSGWQSFQKGGKR